MNRGQLSKKIQEIANKRLGRDISKTELRLIPYIQYVMVNSQKIEPRHINGEERKTLQTWREAGYIEGGASGLGLTKDFWDFMCEVLWEGYVIFESREE